MKQQLFEPPAKPAMEKTDQTILREYRAGQTDALATLVERYRKPLFRFILNMTGIYNDADDIFQEVWLRAIRNMDGFDDRNIMGWLFQIARNLAVDRSRRKKTLLSLEAENQEGAALKNSLPDTRKTPEQAAALNDQAARVARALNGLAPEQKEVFLLRVEADMPFKEIAAIQGVSINTALGRMHYAVTQLKRCIEKED